jgi:hypothetical protein
MLLCPMPTCKKPLARLSPTCPNCQADLSLLVDYVKNLQAGLDTAEERTRAGDLGGAVWAYLEVLEVDPDNSEARRQVGQVTAAVRQFDRSAPGRRWRWRLERRARFRHAVTTWAGDPVTWATFCWWLLVFLLVLALGFFLGRLFPPAPEGPPAAAAARHAAAVHSITTGRASSFSETGT